MADKPRSVEGKVDHVAVASPYITGDLLRVPALLWNTQMVKERHSTMSAMLVKSLTLFGWIELMRQDADAA